MILFLLTRSDFSVTILSYHKNYILILDQVQRFCLTEPRLLHRESGMGVKDFISRSGHATVTGSDSARQLSWQSLESDLWEDAEER